MWFVILLLDKMFEAEAIANQGEHIFAFFFTFSYLLTLPLVAEHPEDKEDYLNKAVTHLEGV